MYKKILGIIFIIIITCQVTNDISAKTNLTKDKVKIEYNSMSKQLFVYGYNKQGNLGVGNTIDVLKENMVNLNKIIGNKKIVDYVFTDSQTYLLTETGEIFGSGYKIGDGSKNIRTTFKELKLINKNKVKVTSLSVMYNGNNCGEVNDIKANCDLNIRFNTNNNKKYYEMNHNIGAYTKELRFGKWNSTYLFNEYRYKQNYLLNLMYFEKQDKNKIYESFFNSDAKRLIGVTLDKNKKTIKKTFYKNGFISSSKFMSEKKTVAAKYNNGILIKKEIKNYKNYKKAKRLKGYLRYTTKQTTYYYNKGKLKQRNTKKLSNNKLRLYSKKFYYPNSKNQYKSNGNGNAYVYTTYYKNGKSIVTYKYKLNTNGKMINKTKVKTKTMY